MTYQEIFRVKTVKPTFVCYCISKSCHGWHIAGQLNVPKPMKRTKLPSGPWHNVEVDLIGPMPTGKTITSCSRLLQSLLSGCDYEFKHNGEGCSCACCKLSIKFSEAW